MQTNKKWSALKQSQREWIMEQTRHVHAEYIDKHKQLPIKKQKNEVLSIVFNRVEERNIWIPYGEFERHIASYIDKLNRKSKLNDEGNNQEPKL